MKQKDGKRKNYEEKYEERAQLYTYVQNKGSPAPPGVTQVYMALLKAIERKN